MSTLRIVQDSEYQGEELLDGTKMAYWKWRAWIAGDVQELEQIVSVTWLLHPTFPNPTRISVERKTNFRIVTGGWGEFRLRASVNQASGVAIALDRWLHLALPASQTTAASTSPTVFLAYGASDARMAQNVQELLTSKGARVLEVTNAEPGLPVAAAIDELVGRSDRVVAIASSSPQGRNVARVLTAADERKVPVLHLSSVTGDTRQALDDFLSPTSAVASSGGEAV